MRTSVKNSWQKEFSPFRGTQQFIVWVLEEPGAMLV
jgi:hypothetical protein